MDFLRSFWFLVFSLALRGCFDSLWIFTMGCFRFVGFNCRLILSLCHRIFTIRVIDSPWIFTTGYFALILNLNLWILAVSIVYTTLTGLHNLHFYFRLRIWYNRWFVFQPDLLDIWFYIWLVTRTTGISCVRMDDHTTRVHVERKFFDAWRTTWMITALLLDEASCFSSHRSLILPLLRVTFGFLS